MANTKYRVNIPRGVDNMARKKESFYNKIASTNIMSDGMLKEVSYGDFALMMALKDKPQDVHGKKR